MRFLLKLLLVPLSLLFTVPLLGQDSTAENKSSVFNDRPRLVVGIVVDQMRYEYIPRFWSKFGDDGFKRMIGNGFTFTNHRYNYFPTYTGPGHAAIYTGTTPSVNGIVGNSWYQRGDKAGMYVVSDTTVQTIGGGGDARSPANLLSTTFTDELKKAVPESKVVAVSIKDRGAVLPAGHLGDGAYWYDSDTGHFVTSSWYADGLAPWVQAFNENGLARQYSTETWELLLPEGNYSESNADNSIYEGSFSEDKDPVFPHPMDSSLSRIRTSPFGNSLLNEFAKMAVSSENLGSDSVTDFLGVSFSSTDYVGHRFGPNSVEVEDTYLRLDQEIANLLNHLDENVGKENYIVFLTSDHGVVDAPASLMDQGLPGGYFDSRSAFDGLVTHLNTTFGEGEWIEQYQNQQIYLNHDLIEEQNLSLEIVQHETARFLEQFAGVKSTNTAYNLQTESYGEGLQAMYQRGHYPKRSGDVYIQLAPGWLNTSSRVGSTHGSPYTYDTHVPLIFYGWNIPHGSSNIKTVIPQIAPTISNMLQIEFPSGSDSNILRFD